MECLRGDDLRLAFSPNLKSCSSAFRSALTLGFRAEGRDSKSAFIYQRFVGDLRSLELNSSQLYRDKCAVECWEDAGGFLR